MCTFFWTALFIIIFQVTQQDLEFDLQSAQYELSAVYTWVNGSDPVYKESQKKYPAGGTVLEDKGANRWRDNQELRFSLRSLEKNAPWFKKIYIVINDGTQPPNWLNRSNPKVEVVYASSLFPYNNPDWIPTFNSNVLELNLYNIKNITTRFVYFNDDFFLLEPVQHHHFITAKGGPKFFLSTETSTPAPEFVNNAVYGRRYQACLANTNAVLDKEYGVSTRKIAQHAPYVYHKAAWYAIHNKFGSKLNNTFHHRYRQPDDINSHHLHNHFIRHEIARANSGFYSPIKSSVGDYYSYSWWWTFWNTKFLMAGKEFYYNINWLSFWKPKILCINDDYDAAPNPDSARKSVRKWLLSTFPHQSSFEVTDIEDS